MKETITGADLKNIEIAARIRELREISGISQEEMAVWRGMTEKISQNIKNMGE
jgi:DNA-binding XRE family transcriptional regulator